MSRQVALACETNKSCRDLLGSLHWLCTLTCPAALLPQAPPRVLRTLVAEQLMSSPAQGLPCIVPVAAAEALLQR